MAIAEGTQPVPVTSTTNVATTAAFTPPSNCTLVAVCAIGNSTGTGTVTGAVTDSLGGVWTLAKRQNVAQTGAEVWTRPVVGAGASMTVTLTGAPTANGKGTQLTVRSLTGNGLAVGASAGASGASAQVNITPQAIGSYLVCAVADSDTSHTLTILAADTTFLLTQDATNGETYASCKQTALTSVLTATAIGFSGTTGASTQVAAVEIKETVAAVPNPPARARKPAGRNNRTLVQGSFPR